jgi:hypothetical protein
VYRIEENTIQVILKKKKYYTTGTAPKHLLNVTNSVMINIFLPATTVKRL